MNRFFCAIVACCAALTFVSAGVADDAAQPSDAERQAVAALHAAGASLTIDGDYRVVSVSFSGWGRVSGDRAVSPAPVPTDEDLAHLAALHHLQTLTLSGVTVGDKTLEILQQLKSLRQLVLGAGSIGPEQLEQLRTALPDCRIRDPRGFGGDRVGTADSRRDDRGGPGAGFGGWGGLAFGRRASLVLRLPNVQADLKLTPEQQAKTQEVSSAAYREKREDEDIRALLSPEQYARLKQVQLQVEGIAAIARPEVAADLQLTDAQRETVANLVSKHSEAVRALPGTRGPGARESAAETRAARSRLDDQLSADLLAALTDEQRDRWEEMLGPPLAPIRFESAAPGTTPAGDGE